MTPILYSFRRCPYAMRARMGLVVANVRCELREILLRDKPASMLEASAKGTVPVLVLPDQVIDESLDVLNWALEQNDPETWKPQGAAEAAETESLISESDGSFKTHLDRYKYSNRYDDADPVTERALAEVFIAKLETRLGNARFLLGDKPRLADVAIFPFIRQFAGADRELWKSSPFPKVHAWLEGWTSSPRFVRCMDKNPPWKPSDEKIFFPPSA